MGTAWSDVITNNAMVYIDDIRMREELATNPAAYFRKMAFWVQNSLPMLNRPPELRTFLETGLIEPKFDNFEWASTEESTTAEQTVVETGKTGFELCSCVIATMGADGMTVFTPYTEFSYDAETGNVTFPTQDEEGIDYILDFYTDGSFAGTLSFTQRRLLGLAIALTWDTRFSRDWVANTMKNHDKSFTTVNESNYMDKTESRVEQNSGLFFAELRKYEADCAVANIRKNSGRMPSGILV